MKQIITITDLRQGEKATVVTLRKKSGSQFRKLAAFGLMPGMEVEVLQTFPAYVLRVNFTQLALDHEMASSIVVQR